MLVILAGNSSQAGCLSLFIQWLVLLVIMVGYEAVMLAGSSGWIFCLCMMAMLMMLAGISGNAL
jgi:hypothetical protein